MKPGVERLEVSTEELEALLEGVREPLGEDGYQKLKAAIRTLGYVTELLENLGVLHLFKVTEGPLTVDCPETFTHTTANPGREELTRACKEAHDTLMQINPENVPKFKEVSQFMAEELKKLKGPA